MILISIKRSNVPIVEQSFAWSGKFDVTILVAMQI